MSLFGPPAKTPEPEGERPAPTVPTLPPPWNRRAVVVLAVLAVALVLTVIAVKVIPSDPVPTRPILGQPWNDILSPSPEDIERGQAVAAGMKEMQTDPAAWSHVAQVGVIDDKLIIRVDTRSAAVTKRVCQQARRYNYAPYGPKLRHLMIFSNRGILTLNDKKDTCLAR
jgi:hypothetical protein